MIQLRNISLTLGTHPIFNDISFLLTSGQHIGVIGRNGAGKSTLLKIIAGHINPDKGSIILENGKKLAYMPQEITLISDKTVLDETLTVFQKFIDIEIELKELEIKLSKEECDLDLVERYSQLQEQYQYFDKSQTLFKVKSILIGLGFKEEDYNKSVKTLSVGWKMRLVLAQLLLQEADFYLFDEPTNHLDIITQQWFFEFIKNSQFGFLLVSHDRYFLDGVCDNVIELERGSAAFYRGNFTAYLVEKEKKHKIIQATYEGQQKEIFRKQATINRFKASSNKAKMAQSMIKQLDKMKLIEIEPPLPNISLKFPEITRSGLNVLTIKSLKQSFNNITIFDNINFTINRGEKVAIIAPNGTGKTTLFNTIVGKYVPDNGVVNFGHNVEHAFFEQDQLKTLTLRNTIFEEISSSCNSVTEVMIRSFLGAFLFSGDDVNKPISVLSGGERNRVAMVKVLLQKANFLLLDEPTNHLDLYAKDALTKALKQYNGTLLIVSHDHSFLDAVATRVLVLTPEEIIDFPGTYSEYIDYKKISDNNKNTIKSNVSKSKKSIQVDQKETKNTYSYKKELRSLEAKIQKLEQKITNLNKKFLDNPYGTNGYSKINNELKQLKDEFDSNAKRWEELFEYLA